MRISDWSSDVCSSDLLASARLAQLDRLIPLEQRQRGLAMLPAMEKNETRERLAAVSAAAPPPPAKPKPSPHQTASQNGRASCRDRVCQYVSISEVAASLKKKKK